MVANTALDTVKWGVEKMNPDFIKRISAWTALKGGGNYNQTKNVVDIKTIEALSQFIGYVKYAYYSIDSKRNQSDKGDIRVYFRGQTKHYLTTQKNVNLFPSIFRKVNSLKMAKDNFDKLEEFIKENEHLFMDKGRYPYAYTAILQQYGLSTEWLDIVDNIWSALWFASHGLEKIRNSSSEDNIQLLKYVESEKDYSYIYVMAFEKLMPQKQFFLKKENLENAKDGEIAEVIDLRMAIPSMYLRPHCQHALMVRKKINWSSPSMSIDLLNLQDHLVATLRIKTKDVLKWLGTSELLSNKYFFPSLDFDEGYKILYHEMKKRELPLEPCLGKLAQYSFSC